MINENLQVLHLFNLLSFSSLAPFFSCFNSFYLLSRVKFGIRARLLIVLTINRSICHAKKKRRYCSYQKILFIDRHYSSSLPANSRHNQHWSLFIALFIIKNYRCRAHHPHERADWASPIATKTHDIALQHPRRQIASPPTAGHSPRH